jgi:hypothetical protein
MKYKAFLVALLFMSLFVVHAFGEVTDAEYWEKVRQLDQLAERFKAETGFTGNVSYYFERMELQSYEGKFADIPFSADADTISFRLACNRILDKIIPYSFAKRSKLSMSRISSRTGYISTDFYQLVNGYRVEGYGFIVITYDAGRYRFDIGDNTVELPDEPLGNIISQREAEMIALKDMNDEHYILAKVYNLFYSKEGSDLYYLAYLVIVDSNNSPLYESYVYWIDAINGRIKKSEELGWIE